MQSNSDIQVDKSVEELIVDLAQWDLQAVSNISSGEPSTAIETYQKAIDSFKNALLVLVDEEHKNVYQVAKIKDVLKKAYLAEAASYEQQQNLAGARYCYMQAVKLFELPLNQYLLELEQDERLRIATIEEDPVLGALLSEVTSEMKYLTFSEGSKVPFQRTAEMKSKESALIKGMQASSTTEVDDSFQGVVETKDLVIQWEENTKRLIFNFLDKIKESILQTKHSSILISYVKSDLRIEETILKLKAIFERLEITIVEREYQSTAILEQDLKQYSHAIILVTPQYKEAANKQQEREIKEVLDNFGKQTEAVAKLHVLLCDGDFETVAKKVIDDKYLIRDYIKVFNNQVKEYKLCLDTELPADGIPLKGRIYLAKQEDRLKYMVLNPRGELIEAFLNIQVPEELTKEILNSKKEEILENTSKRGHTERTITSDFQEQASLLGFIDHLFNPSSYAYGIGVLPSILDLSSKEYDEQHKQYKHLFYDFYKQQQRLNLEYRFKKILLESYKKNEAPLSYLRRTEKVQQIAIQQQINIIIDNLLKTSSLKTNLILCQGTLDETLVNWVLERQLMLRKDIYVISIDCGRKYKIKDKEHPGCGVLDFLTEKLCLKQHEIEEFTKQKEEQVVILFKNYDRLGVYENLYVKNKLSNWPNLKVLVTCNSLFFQHRSYESCFLPDPGVIDLSSIRCDTLNGIFLEKENNAFKETTDILRPEGLRRSSVVEIKDVSATEDFNKIKIRAIQEELTGFLKIINKAFVENKTLNAKVEANSQIFISYAWEPAGESRTRQQNHLKQIAKDLYTLGFLTWLDLERMIGNIEQQMEGNIENSRYVLVIGAPLYTKRATLPLGDPQKPTNVEKEFSAIIKKRAGKDQFTVFPIKFLPKGAILGDPKEYESFPDELLNHDDYANLLDFCGIDNGEEYLKQLTSPYNPKGLIPRLLDLDKPQNATRLEEYIKFYEALKKRLQLLPASHLLVDKGQDDVQAYDIDGRLEVYIEPSGVTTNPAQTTEVIPKFNLEKSLSDFLQHPKLKTYVALGDAGSGKTLFTLWTFKKYVLQPWHNYRNKELKIYLCSKEPELSNIKPNAIYLYLEEGQVKYVCLVKNHKHEGDLINKREAQKITITETSLSIYGKLKKELIELEQFSQLKEFSYATKLELLQAEFLPDIHDRNEFFSMIKPKWLPIYVPLKNYAYLDKKQTPQQYIEGALLSDYHISLQDLLELKKGLNHQQNILFILDGYDELGKGNNPNFSQSLLNSYEDILLCPQKPTESAIQEEFLYIYLKQEKPYLLLKKVEQTGKTTIIDKEISEKRLIEQLKPHFSKIKSTTPLLDATLIDALFRYTAKWHQTDLQAHGLRWKYAKIFVTGRPEHFDNEQQYQAAFALLDQQNPINFEVNYMARFTPQEIEKYIIEYKQSDPKCEQELIKLETASSKTTLQILETFGNLKELLTNPFLLNITLQALPILIKKTDISITRASIYEAFIEYWYTKEISRKEKSLSSCSTAECYQFAEQLAMQMFINNTISISEKQPNSWEFKKIELWKFFNNIYNNFARETCPLSHSGKEFSFIHKSIYEYLLARYLVTIPWEEIQEINGIKNGYNASIARLLKEEPSVFSFIQDFVKQFIPKNTNCCAFIFRSATQKINLYNIFLELLQWNEPRIAINLIKGEQESQNIINETELLLENLLSEPLINDVLDIRNKYAIALTYGIWTSNKEYLKMEYIEKLKDNVDMFLNIISWGEQDLAEKMLKINPKLSILYGTLIDCSGRIFTNITALQYSVWALDYHMWNMINKYIIKEEAKKQLEKLLDVAKLNEKKGWIKNSESYISWHSLSWLPLLEALDHYSGTDTDNDNGCSNSNYSYNWYDLVGRAQLLLPAHVINEYNNPLRGFSPCPNWREEEISLPRCGLISWRFAGKNKETHHEHIGDCKAGLGVDFAWYRSDSPECVANSGEWQRCGNLDDVHMYLEPMSNSDGHALGELLKIRVEQAKCMINSICQNLLQTKHSARLIF